MKAPRTTGFSLLHLLVCLSLLQTATAIAPSHLTAQSRSITVTGIVRDASSGEPLVAVTIVRDSLAVAVTNEAGMYETSEIVVDGASTSLVFRRIGYASNAQDVALLAVGTAVRVDVTLLPSPTNLERIVVSGERVVVANPGLVGFYERREEGFGRYLTGEEIARIGGIDLTNHLRRLRCGPNRRRT